MYFWISPNAHRSICSFRGVPTTQTYEQRSRLSYRAAEAKNTPNIDDTFKQSRLPAVESQVPWGDTLNNQRTSNRSFLGWKGIGIIRSNFVRARLSFRANHEPQTRWAHTSRIYTEPRMDTYFALMHGRIKGSMHAFAPYVHLVGTYA